MIIINKETNKNKTGKKNPILTKYKILPWIYKLYRPSPYLLQQQEVPMITAPMVLLLAVTLREQMSIVMYCTKECGRLQVLELKISLRKPY